MKLFLLVSLLLSALSSSAQLAIYNWTGTQLVIGSGIEAKVRITGVLIIDLAQNRAVRAGKFTVPSGKQFNIDDEPNFTAWRAQGSKAITTLVTSIESSTNAPREEASIYYMGKEANVTIGPGTNTMSLPKTIKGSGFAVLDEGGQFVNGLGTISLVHSYSQKETIGANTRGETIEQAVERWRQAYIAQGYTEAEED